MTDITVHRSNLISIKDLNHDLNISENKWDFIFDFILQQTNVAYFRGTEIDYHDESFEEDLIHLSEKILFDCGKDHLRILFRTKLSHLLLNRNHISKMWDIYHFPCLIFMKDDLQEEELIRLVVEKAYLTEIVTNIDGVYILYRDIESNVLWLLSSPEMPIPKKINLI